MLKEAAQSSDREESLRLDNQLCFALYAGARAITRVYRESLEEHGLTYPQFVVLLVLWEEDGLTISAIGERLMLDSGTLTPLLKRLEAMDVVRRERGLSDGREVHIHLTKKGQSLMDAAADARRHVVCRLGMSEDQIRKLRTEIMAMVESLSPEPEES